MGKTKNVMSLLIALALVMLFADSNAYAGHNRNHHDGNNECKDNNCQSVPEPSTMLLLASGLGGLAWKLRNRSK